MALLSHNPENRRQLGERLAVFVCSSSFRVSGSNSLVGVIADLVADDPVMGPPLRDLVTRPVFLNLLPSASKGGEGVLAQRDSLLTELSRTYNPGIVAAIGDVLNGFLGIHNSTEDARHFSRLLSHFPIDGSSKYDEANSDIEHLRRLIASHEWHKADRQTWSVLQNSINSNRGYISDNEWSLIPCDLIQEIDIIWSEGSTFRYGFSIQKAIWDEIVSQIRVRESYESVELSATPSKIFYSLLRSSEAKHDHFRPGFFPGYGVWAHWDSSRYEWNIAESSSGLISSFNLLCEKLRSCGPSFNEIPLDSRTVSEIKKLVDSAPFSPSEKTKDPITTQSNSPSLDPDAGNAGCSRLLLSLLAIIVIAGIAVSYQDASSPDQQTPGESAASETDPRQQQREKAALAKLDSLQSELKQAVLICEIKPLINQIKAVQATGISAAVKRKNTMITNANKRIAFLDAEGEMKYDEFGRCSYGGQYYDDSTDPSNPDQLRVFIAVSRKCKNPKLVVKYSLADDQNYIPRLEYTKPITGHITGPISFPYPKDRSYFYNASVLCS